MGEERGCRKKETETVRGIEKGREGQTETNKHKVTLPDSCYPYMKLNEYRGMIKAT